jgi:hypothetical protein
MSGGAGRTDRRAVRDLGAPALSGAGIGAGEGIQKADNRDERHDDHGADVAHYEQLRARALAGDAGGWRCGLGVVQHRTGSPGCAPGTPSPPPRRP